MSPYKFINPIFKAKAANTDTDFSSFLPVNPLTRKQRLIEECEKQDVSIYVDDPSEQSAGVYSIFRCVASETELEHRLNAKKITIFPKRANLTALLALIVSAIALVKTFF